MHSLTAGSSYKGEVVRLGLQIGSVFKSLYIIMRLCKVLGFKIVKCLCRQTL